MKKYSVLMSLYIKENPKYFQQALESMLHQTIKPNEIIIVKDGTISNQLEALLNSYTKNYPNLIKIVGYSTNKGLGYALNYGLRYCQNEFVARMDTDDIALCNRCELELRCFDENPSLSIVGSYIEEFIDDVSNVIGRREVPLTDEKIKKYLKYRCPLNHMTVMFRKSAVIHSGGYKTLLYNEDYYLWLRMFQQKYIFKNLPNVLVKVRSGKKMYQRRGGIKYFLSEKTIQDYMLQHKIITPFEYCINLFIRFIVQICMSNFARGLFFRIFARQ